MNKVTDKRMRLRFVAAMMFLSMCLAVSAQSANWLWGRSAGGTDNEYGRAVCTDVAGNLYVSGISRSPAIGFGGDTLFNPNGTSFNGLLFTVKYSSTGNVIWAKTGVAVNTSPGQIGNDSITGTVCDSSGNVYVTGGFASPEIIFGQDTLVNKLGQSSVFVVKYDSLGNVAWARSAGGGNNQANAISCDPQGNVYITGRFADTAYFGAVRVTGRPSACFFITKYDTAGNVVWVESASDTTVGYGVANDAAANVYVTGYFAGSCSFTSRYSLVHTNLRSASGSRDIFIIKYDSTGHIDWARTGVGMGTNVGTAISVQSKVAVTGYFESDTLVLGSDTLLNNAPAGTNIFTAMFDTAGTTLWAKTAGDGGNDQGNSISTDNAGYTFVTGNFDSATIVFGDTLIIRPQVGNIFIVKYDTAGKVIWAKSTDGEGYDAITNDAAGNIYFTGGFNSLYFMCGSDTLTNVDIGPWWDFFVAKLGASDSVITTGLAQHGPDAGNAMIYPNPSSGNVMISGIATGDAIEIYDATGKLILTQVAGVDKQGLNLSGFAKGLYLYRIVSANLPAQQGKFVLQ